MRQYKKPLNIVLLGRSGSGKGTQLNLLKKKLPLIEIDTGGLLRRFIKQKNKVAQNIAKIMAKGNLVPSWLAVCVWLPAVIKAPDKKGLIFEGSPRTLYEAKVLHEVLKLADRRRLRVIYLDVPEKEVKKRLLARRICAHCGREYSLELTPGLKRCPVCGGRLVRRLDDTPKAINSRMKFFKEYIIPVIKYFKKEKILIKINGVGSIEEIHQRIVKRLRI